MLKAHENLIKKALKVCQMEFILIQCLQQNKLS